MLRGKWNNGKTLMSVLLILFVSSINCGYPSSIFKRDPLDVFSFDYSAHESPLAYRTHEASIELMHKTKLIPKVKDNYGAYFLKKVRNDDEGNLEDSNWRPCCMR